MLFTHFFSSHPLTQEPKEKFDVKFFKGFRPVSHEAARQRLHLYILSFREPAMVWSQYIRSHITFQNSPDSLNCSSTIKFHNRRFFNRRSLHALALHLIPYWEKMSVEVVSALLVKDCNDDPCSRKYSYNPNFPPVVRKNGEDITMKDVTCRVEKIKRILATFFNISRRRAHHSPSHNE